MEQCKDDTRRRSKRQWFARVFRRIRNCVITDPQQEQWTRRARPRHELERSEDSHQETPNRLSEVASASGEHREKRQGSGPQMQSVVKHTFLEFVLGDTGSSPELPLQTQRRARAHTDTALEYTEYSRSESDIVITSHDDTHSTTSEENLESGDVVDEFKLSEGLCGSLLSLHEDMYIGAANLESFASTADGFEELRADQPGISGKCHSKMPSLPTVPSSGASSWSSSVGSIASNVAAQSPTWPMGLVPAATSQPVTLQQNFPGGWPMSGSNEASIWNHSSNTPASSDDQNLRAAELEVQAALLKLSALQAEAAARKMPASSPNCANTPASMWLEAMTRSSIHQGSSSASSIAPPARSAKVGRKSVSKSKKTDVNMLGAPIASRSFDSPSLNAGLNNPCNDIQVTENTTVMLRHLPVGCTRDWLVRVLDSQGFSTCYDFVYLPVDFVKWQNFGYAFVNFVSPREALRSWQHFTGFSTWPKEIMSASGSEKSEDCTCEVSWGDPLQGLEAYVERYRDSPVMHREVPEPYKPVIFAKGVRVPFPAPTKRIRRPRLKLNSVGASEASNMDLEGKAANGDAAGGFPAVEQ